MGMTKEERRIREQQKLEQMLEYEKDLWQRGLRLVAGIDEVGRGPLAGPVVTAAVILPEDFDLPGVDDSKKLSQKKREEMFEKIKERAVCYAIGMRDNLRIDEINILEATKEAMRQAVEELEQRPQHILIDALTLKGLDIPQTSIVKGDEKSVSIAAASILAKVTRDRMMEEYHREYPWYAFDHNKGYGTKAHYEGIAGHGVCPLHRRSFLKNIL